MTAADPLGPSDGSAPSPLWSLSLQEVCTWGAVTALMFGWVLRLRAQLQGATSPPHRGGAGGAPGDRGPQASQAGTPGKVSASLSVSGGSAMLFRVSHQCLALSSPKGFLHLPSLPGHHLVLGGC